MKNFLLNSLRPIIYWACLVFIPLILGLSGNYKQACLILAGTAVFFIINLLERVIDIFKQIGYFYVRKDLFKN